MGLKILDSRVAIKSGPAFLFIGSNVSLIVIIKNKKNN
jgi:hypothetical protein